MQKELLFKEKLGNFFVKNRCEVFIENIPENDNLNFGTFDWQDKRMDSEGNILGKRLDMIIFHNGLILGFPDPFGLELKAGGELGGITHGLMQLNEYKNVEFYIPNKNWKGKLHGLGFINEWSFDKGRLYKGNVYIEERRNIDSENMIIQSFFNKFGLFTCTGNKMMEYKSEHVVVSTGVRLRFAMGAKTYYLPSYEACEL